MSGKENYQVYQLLRPYEPFTVAYIGIGRKNRRPKQHLASAKRGDHPNRILLAIFRKSFALGHKNLIVRILADGLSRDDACQIERQQIAIFGRIDNKTGVLANLTNGGDGSDGWVMSQSTKDKISAKATGRLKSEETLHLISAGGKGLKRSADTCEKIRKANLNKKRSEKMVEAMREGWKRRKKNKDDAVKLATGQLELQWEF